MFHEMKEQGQKLGLYKSVGWMNSRQACIHLTVSKVKVKAIAFSQFHPLIPQTVKIPSPGGFTANRWTWTHIFSTIIAGSLER